jgi:pyruvate formate lyase activating enzyme
MSSIVLFTVSEANEMTAAKPFGSTPLEAKSPYELRVDLGKDVPEVDVKAAMASGDVGFLHSFTTGSAVDGPGVRLVAWTTACMFRCRFCHNPDTWTMSNGIPVPLTRAIEEVRKYAHALKLMRGGLTVSGGEPLVQNRFTVKLFRAAKQLGVHTAMESNGFLGARLSDEELDLIDLVILDIKAFEPEQHKRVTGVDNETVLAFAKRLAEHKRPMWLRYVLVPGLMDDRDEMRRVASFGASLGVVERAEILPFHQMGRYKWQRLGIDYTLDMTQPPSDEALGAAVAIFREEGLRVH